MKKYTIILLTAFMLTFTTFSCVDSYSNKATTTVSIQEINTSAKTLSRLEGKIEYENYLGYTRPDNDAKVILVSKTHFQSSGAKPDLNFKTATFSTETDDEGHFNLTHLPKGKYFVIIQSENVNNFKSENPEGFKPKMELLAPVLRNKNKLTGFSDIQSMVITEIDLSTSGYTILTHNFGHNI